MAQTPDAYVFAHEVQYFFQKAVLPAIALIATGAAKVVVSRLQSNTNVKRSVELTKRISELETTIAKLPKRDNSELPITPHMVLTDELKMTIAELKYLQTRVHYSFHQFCSDVSFKTRRAFVLYRPEGFLGFVLNYSFYAYLALMLLLIGVIVDSSRAGSGTGVQQTALSGKSAPPPGTPLPTNASSQAASGMGVSGAPAPPQSATQKDLVQTKDYVFDVLAFMLMFGVLSIPALVLRYFALRRLDRAGTTSAVSKKKPANEPSALPGPVPSQVASS